MKRHIRNFVYFFLIASLFFTANKFYSLPPSFFQIQGEKQNFLFSAGNPQFEGMEPQEKIARLVNMLHNLYPEAAIAGLYGINPLTETDFVKYRVELKFPQPKSPAEFDNIEKKRKQIIGELAVGTARLFSVETNIPNVGSNNLYDMMIVVSTIIAAKPEDEQRQGLFYLPHPFLQENAEDFVYIFDSGRIKRLLEEKDISKWSKYAVVRPHAPAIPNTGVIENPKPLIPDK